MLAEPYSRKLFESLKGLHISVAGSFINHLNVFLVGWIHIHFPPTETPTSNRNIITNFSLEKELSGGLC